MKLLLAPILALSLFAQSGTSQAESAKLPAEKGIPVTSELVISKCGTCHSKDADGNLLRISWERATPEGWEEAIKRMVRLRGVRLTPEEAHSILKYLGTYHGLAPEEAKPILYYAEHRIQDETNIPNDNVRGACANCHPMARPLSWRRSQEDWKLLANLHVALYPQADEAFRLGINAGGFDESRHHLDPGALLPVDVALAYLGKTAPLETPEWAAWRARMRAPKLAGRWLVSAHIPGRGRYYGEMEVASIAGTDDEFTTKVTLTSGEGRSRDFALRPRVGLRRLCLARPVKGHASGECRARRSGERDARGYVGFARPVDGRRALVLGPVSGVRRRREDAAGHRRPDADRGGSVVA